MSVKSSATDLINETEYKLSDVSNIKYIYYPSKIKPGYYSIIPGITIDQHAIFNKIATDRTAEIWDGEIEDAFYKISRVIDIGYKQYTDYSTLTEDYFSFFVSDAIDDPLASNPVGLTLPLNTYVGGVRVGVSVDTWFMDKSSNFNSEDKWPAEKVILHEILHGFGLVDYGTYNFLEPDDRYTIISYKPGIEGVPNKNLGIYDIYALQVMYGGEDGSGINFGSENGDTTYIYSSNKIDTGAIWDGGGVDEISAHNQSESVLIDLRQGELSDINSSPGYQYNSGIALGVVVENANGSDKGDIIIGNISSNIIHGNGGDDRIYADGGAYRDNRSLIDYFKLSETTVNEELWEYDFHNGENPYKNQDDKIYGGSGNDRIYGGSGINRIYGGDDDDYLVASGKWSDLSGGAGADQFLIGSNTVILDGNGEDSASYFGIPLFGGIQQWWASDHTAVWSPFTSLLAAYPFIGTGIIMVGAVVADIAIMNFVQYQKDQYDDLKVYFAWGLAGSATVKNYDLDLNTGIGSANITVFRGLLEGMVDNGDIARANMGQFVNLALRAGFGSYFGTDPLVLDLDGDGFELTSSLVSTSRFEFDTDGFAERSGWVAPDDGFLVRDANANGKIDNLTEMFGNQTTGGFAMLATHDSNSDGVLNASDAVFASLKVWQDLNQDGETQSGELRTLTELGIVSINLTHAPPAQTTNILGNVVMQVGSFTLTGGVTRDIADVALQIDETKTRWLGDSTVSVAAAALPQLMGYGNVVDLRIAMTDDATLLDMVDDLVTSTPTGFDDLAADVEAILYRWAGVDGVAATALGSNGFDTRKLAFLEKFVGRALMPRETNGDIDLVNLAEVEALWADQLPRLTLRLAAQGPLSTLFAGFDYNVERDLLIADSAGSVSNLLRGLIEDLPSGHGAAVDQWAAWAPLLGVVSESAIRFDNNVLRSDFLVAQLVSAMDGVTQPLSFAELVAGMGLTNVRTGTTGADTLTRSSTERTVIYYGAGGDDVLTGGTGQDVYIFGRVIGDATINDEENYAGGDRIMFAFLNSADVTLERDGNDLLITVIATDETIRVTGQFAPVVPFSSDVLLSTNKGVEEIVFADGEVMSIPDIMIATGKGTAGNDHVIGTMHSDALQGGLGNDTLEGGDNADIYVVNAGEGDDVIHDVQSTPLLRAMDMLVFGDDIAPSDLVFSRAGTDNGDLLITIGTSGDSLLIKDQFDYGVLGFNSKYATNSRIEAFAFREYGETYTNRQIQDMLIRQATTSGKDMTIGFGDDDQFLASAGDDTLVGLDGADTYYFGTGAGHDTIDEQALYIDVNVSLSGISFNHLADTIVFSPDLELEDLTFSRVAGNNNLLITVTATGDTLTVVDQFAGFQTGPLGAQWFDRVEWFAFGDNSKISWKDVLSDVTTGGTGNDTLIGDLYTDTLSGGAGNDFLSGRGYADTYVFGLGDGHDTIEDDNTSYFGSGFVTPDKTPDILMLGAGIDTGDVTLVRNGKDIDLIIGSGGDRVTLRNQNDHFHSGPLGILSNSTIEQVHFADKTVWTWQDLNDRLIADATTSGNDTTEGFVFDERFEASAGNDTLMGRDGADTYVFGTGSGHDVIRESVRNVLYSDWDTVEFASGVLPGDVTLSRSGNNLIVSLSKDDSLTIEGQFTYSSWFTWNDVEAFRFSNSVVWSAQDVRQMLLQSTAGADTLIGFASSDTLAGGAGNDVLEGSDGSDTYLFNPGDGADIIRETLTNSNLPENDRLVFGGGISSDDVTFTRDGADLVISVDGTGDSVRIQGQFDFSNWFAWWDVEQFEFADKTLSHIDIAAIIMGGTSGDDSIIGTFRSDLLDGREGNDTLEGGDGADRYVFGLGYGNDEIRESLSNANLSENDQLEFLAGIALQDLAFQRLGNDLKITITGTSDSVLIKGQFNNNGYFTWQDIDRFAFADGSFVSRLEVQQMLLQPTSGADHQIGFISDDTLNGGAGNDTLEGRDGADTYIFDRGYGHDLIIETLTDGNLSEFDTVALAAGIAPGDVTLSRNGQNLIITLDSGDTLTVKDHFNEGNNESLTYWDVDRILFADGTIWTKPDIATRVIHPTTGNDSIPGTWYSATVDGLAGNDTIRGGGGQDSLAGGAGADQLYGDKGNDTLAGGADNDTLIGGGHDDIYRFGLGDGQDVIQEFSSYFDGDGGNDTIELGAGITTANVTISQADGGNDLLISINGTSDKITVDNGITGGYLYAVEQLKFADGTIWDRSELFARSSGGTMWNDAISGDNASNFLFGAAGQDVLTANNGNDTLDGGAGHDVLLGGGGNDTYLFGIGGGQDTIREFISFSSYGGTDTLQLGPGILTTDVTVSQTRDGTGIVIAINGTSDRITIEKGLSDGNYFVDQLRFDDGTIWSYSDLAGRSMASTIGPDQISGSPNSELIEGGGGGDVLTGNNGNDTLDGGAGGDVLLGGGGNDTYLFGIGGGQDLIREFISTSSYGGTDTLQLGPGILTTDVTVSPTRDGTGIMIAIKGTSDRITIEKGLSDGNYFVDQLRFDDGTIWSHADLVNRSLASTGGPDQISGSANSELIEGGDGGDVLAGYNGNDTLDGGAGNDLLLGGAGHDTYLFGIGSGQDTIREFISYYSYGGTDTVLLGAGITTSDVTVSRARDGNDVVIRINGTSDAITLENTLTNANYVVDQLKFADGTIWTASDLATKSLAPPGSDTLSGDGTANTISGGAGNDTIYGRAGNDTLEGGAGDDLLLGAGNDDTYLFGIGDGQDVIREWDGITHSGNDTLQLGAGITTSDVTIVQADSGNALIVKINGTNDQVKIEHTVNDNGHRVEQIRFADGTIWSAATMVALSLQSTAVSDTLYGTGNADSIVGGGGDDALYGRGGNDTLVGGTGNDLLLGAGGNDTYLFGIGDGQDTIREWDGSSHSGTDTLQLGAGITTSDVTIVQADSGNALIVKINGTTDQVMIDYTVIDGAQRVEQMRFADGTIWTAAEMLARSMYANSGDDSFSGGYDGESVIGGAGNDNLNGRTGNDTLVGGTGNDLLFGAGGNDTYLFGIGDGQDIIREWDGSSHSGTDTLQLGAGITVNDVTIVQADNGNGLTVKINGTTDQITIDYTVIDAPQRIEQMRFADGTIWTAAEMLTRSTYGNAGSDVFYGGYDADSLLGGAGNDVIDGRGANDTITGGAGNDDIIGNAGTDTAVFAGLRDGYSLVTSGGSIRIVDNDPVANGDDGTDTLFSVEQAKFSDQTISVAAPIILDLDNDGVELIDLAASDASFDFDGDGLRDRTGWFGAGDGMLVLDRNGDGSISDRSEFSFVDDRPGARSDLEGLAAFDGNEDGVLDGLDAAFASFKVWRDDGDGVSEADELLTLEQAGIASIRLAGTAVDQVWAWGSNVIVNKGDFVRSDGSKGALADVALTYQLNQGGIPEEASWSPPIASYGGGIMATNSVSFC